MLHLARPTEGDWLGRAIAGIDVVLVDHAHLERKAASNAISLTFRYIAQPTLIAPLAALAREELAHFELVLGILAARGIPFRAQEPAPYAARLRRIVRPDEPARLLDMLLCCALIEARSCERMQLLAEGLAPKDPELARLYEGLLVAEARHHRTYVDLAAEIFPRTEVEARLAVVAAHEADAIARPLDDPGPVRLHN